MFPYTSEKPLRNYFCRLHLFCIEYYFFSSVSGSLSGTLEILKLISAYGVVPEHFFFFIAGRVYNHLLEWIYIYILCFQNPFPESL